MPRPTRLIAALLIVTTCATSLPLAAHAGPIATDESVDAATTVSPDGAGPARERVRTWLQREAARDALAALGVDRTQAQARVDALTDDEIAALDGRIDQLPAGGSVFGWLFAGFVVLLVTDILGYTKVFPFTRSIR